MGADEMKKMCTSSCSNVLMFAPLNLTPNLIDVWLYSSEMTRRPFPTKAGIMVEFVVKTMKEIMASSWPTN